MRHCCCSQARLPSTLGLFLEYNAFKSPYNIVTTLHIFFPILTIYIPPWWTHFTSSYFWQRLASLWNGAVIHSTQDSFSHHTRFSKDKVIFLKTDELLPAHISNSMTFIELSIHSIVFSFSNRKRWLDSSSKTIWWIYL